MSRLDPPLTKTDLAREFGVTIQAVGQWFKEPPKKPKYPDWQKLPKLARILHVPVVWLIEGEGRPPSIDDPMVLFEALDERDQAAVVTTMRSMVESERHPRASRRVKG